MEESSVHRYPLDFDAITKGDVIPAETLERITGEKRGTVEYQFKVLKLRGQIEAACRDRDYPVTLRGQGDDLKVLQDEDASPHNERLMNSNLNCFKKHYRQLLEVDMGNLTEEQKKDHERRVLYYSFYRQAVCDAGKKIRLMAEKRSVPGITDGR